MPSRLEQSLMTIARTLAPPVTSHPVAAPGHRNGGTPAVMMLDGATGTIQPVRSNELAKEFQQSWVNTLMASRHRFSDGQLAASFGLSVVAWAAVMKRASLASQLPLKVIDRDGNDLESSPADWFVKNSSRLLWRWSLSHLLWGKSLFLKELNYHGFPTVLTWSNPLDWQVTTDIQGQVNSFHVQYKGTFAPRETVYTFEFDPINDADGLSPYEIALQTVQLDANLVSFASSFFRNRARPDMILTFEGSVTTEEAKRVKDDLSAFRGAANAFKVMVMGAGAAKWNVQTITPDMADLAMPELNEATSSRLCTAISIYPALVGIGSASDPLSAQGTLKQLEVSQLQTVEVPFINRLLEELSAQWLSVDFPAFKGAQIVVDDTEIQAAASLTAERATIASALVDTIADLNEARHMVGLDDAPDGLILRNPKWYTEAWQNGIITRHQYLVGIGLPVDDLPNGLIWEVDPKYTMPPASPFQFTMPGGGDVPPALPAAPAADVTLDEPVAPAGLPEPRFPVSMVLTLPHDPELIRLQERVKAMLPPESVLNWTTAEDYHVTVLYIPAATSKQLATFSQRLESVPVPADFSLRVGSLACFDNLGEYAVHLRVRNNEALNQWQTALYELAAECGLATSAYSVPDNYKPHITLCYSRTHIKTVTFESKIRLYPETLALTAQTDHTQPDLWRLWHKQPLRAQDIATVQNQDNELDELRQWQARVTKKGRHARFIPAVLPVQLVDWINTQLSEGWSIAPIFDHARAWVKAGLRDTLPAPLGFSPDDAFRAWWRALPTALETRMGKEWLTYTAALSPHLKTAAVAAWRAGDSASFDPALDPAPLARTWAGDTDDPGTLTQIALAGVVAGNQALEDAIPATRHWHKQLARQTGAIVDFDLMSQEALDFVEAYSFALVQGINNTTVEAIRHVVAQAIAEGWSIEQLSEALEAVLVEDATTPSQRMASRAETIAFTEAGRAFNEGAHVRWQNAGVQQATWQTVRDGKVCRVCRGLHRSVFNLSEGVLSDVTGERYRTIAHVRCRCFQAPLLPPSLMSLLQVIAEDTEP